jgi:hypothetical protein
MARKKHNPGPIPAGNKSHSGPPYQRPDEDEAEPGKTGEGSTEAFQEEDPKRAIGDYTGTADHARQQPGPRNDGGKRHSEDKS